MTLPNQLTLLRILLTPVFVLLLFVHNGPARIASLIVFVLASLTDWYDGFTARKFGYVSSFGKFLDPLADKILVSSAFICFNVLGYLPTWMVLVVVIRDFIITLLRSYSILKGKPVVTNRLAKIKTFSQYGFIYIIFLIHLFIDGRGDPWPGILGWVEKNGLIPAGMMVIMAVTLLSGFVYLYENKSHVRQVANDIYRIFVPSNI